LQATSALAAPLGIVISVVGYRWLDIDRVIGATASYTVLGVVGLGAALALVPRLAGAAGPALGIDPGVAQWLLTLGPPPAAAPAQLALRPRLERKLFAERHRRASGLATLVDLVGSCTGAEEMWKLTSEHVESLLEPESLTVYTRDGLSFTAR